MHSRRAYLRATAVALTAGVAGCVDGSGDGAAASDGGEGPATGEPGTTATEGFPPPPTADRSLHVPYDMATLRDSVESGGPPKDGIPSIDDPSFTSADDADLDDGEPVFGLVRNGVVRAYPQYIVVYHEIVNDVVGGEGVAVTYCPLTGTAQGFVREETEFGVSGNLLNSNLVMYDRAGDSRWPQMLSTAISGPLAGETLREFRLVWTTWGEWRAAHPDTEVLSEDTGHVRRYGSDPYGDYNPRTGYYDNAVTLFSPLSEDGRARDKRVVIGARTADGAVAFDKQGLLEAGRKRGSIGDTEYVAVADPTLSTGYVYEAPDGTTVSPVGDGTYSVGGDQYGPTELPLDRVLAFDAMWFAWAGFYPDTGYVE